MPTKLILFSRGTLTGAPVARLQCSRPAESPMTCPSLPGSRVDSKSLADNLPDMSTYELAIVSAAQSALTKYHPGGWAPPDAYFPVSAGFPGDIMLGQLTRR
jgi:hypothetical protein